MKSLKHLMIDNQANVVFSAANDKKKKNDLKFKALGDHVHCATRNSLKQNEIAIGSKD